MEKANQDVAIVLFGLGFFLWLVMFFYLVPRLMSYAFRSRTPIRCRGAEPNQDLEYPNGFAEMLGSGKPRVSIDEVANAHKLLVEFNRLDLRNVVLTENGKVLQIPPEKLEEWHFIGMSNDAFVESRFWETEWSESVTGSRD